MILVAQCNCNEAVLKIFIWNVRLDSCQIMLDQKSCNGEGFGTRGIVLEVGMLTADPVHYAIERVGYLGLIKQGL